MYYYKYTYFTILFRYIKLFLYLTNLVAFFIGSMQHFYGNNLPDKTKFLKLK